MKIIGTADNFKERWKKIERYIQSIKKYIMAKS